jgi:hypothetical protein
MADGNLAGIAGEDVQAEGSDHGDPHEIRQTQQMIVAQQGHDHGAKKGHRRHRILGERRRVQLHVGGVAGFEDPALAIDHPSHPLDDLLAKKSRRPDQ